MTDTPASADMRLCLDQICRRPKLMAHIADLEREKMQVVELLLSLQAELAAARKPPQDAEVAKAIEDLTTTSWVYSGPQPKRCAAIADMLTRLSAALKEEDAERERDVWAKDRWGALEVWKSRALATEAKLETARRDGERDGWLRACVFYVDMMAEEEGNPCRAECDRRFPAIRALQKDTAP